MGNSSLVNVKVPAYSGNYTVGRSGRKIELIAIHHMAGVLTAKQCGAIFQKVGRKGSSNYGIGKDADVGLYVDEANTSWCNSNWDSNCKSVTIETSNSSIGGDYPVSDKVLNKLIELVADIAKRNNLGTLVKGKNVVWHSMYTATNCPGKYLLSKLDYICEKANEINGQKASSNTTSNKKSNEEIADEVIAGKWGNGEDRKNKLNSAGYDYNTIQSIVNQKLSGKTNNASKKSNEEVANEVIKGNWGNGADRKNKLEAAGYDYNAIQAIVNSKLGSSTKTKKVTATNGLYIRTKATTDSSKVIAVPYGHTVTVVSENVANANGFNWDKVTYDQYNGYMANKYLG